MRYFKGIGIEAFYRIPNRLEEGYGMNIPALEAVIKMGATLIVSVDNGIAAHEQVDYCNEQGVDVIVTDHHECQGNSGHWRLWTQSGRILTIPFQSSVVQELR